MRQAVSHAFAALVAAGLTFAAVQLNKHPGLQNFVDREAIVIRHFGFACGVERWPVKTLADSRASAINWVPRKTNIAALTAIPPTGEGTRQLGAETTVWQLTGTTIIAFKQEPDSDIHLELRSPAGQTMIAELPLQSCVTANPDPAVATQQQRIGVARAAFQNYLLAHGIQVTGAYQTVNIRAVLTGVGFFDRAHGQRGLAPNAIELHPLLSFKPA